MKRGCCSESRGILLFVCECMAMRLTLQILEGFSMGLSFSSADTIWVLLGAACGAAAVALAARRAAQSADSGSSRCMAETS